MTARHALTIACHGLVLEVASELGDARGVLPHGWREAGGAAAEGPDWLSPNAATGMTPERERELLAAARR